MLTTLFIHLFNIPLLSATMCLLKPNGIQINRTGKKKNPCLIADYILVDSKHLLKPALQSITS